MSISERDAVLREREAFAFAARYYGLVSAEAVAAHAAADYALPKVTQQRVVQWKEALFKLSEDARNGKALWCKPSPEHSWYSDTFTRYEYHFLRDPAFLDLLADLIRRPTEEVEAES